MRNLPDIKNFVSNYAERFDSDGELEAIVFYDLLGLRHEIFKENSGVTNKPYLLRKRITGNDWHSLGGITKYLENLRKMQELYVKILSTCNAIETYYLQTISGVGKEVRFYHTTDNEVSLYVKYSFEEQKFIYRGVLARDGKITVTQMNLVSLLNQAILGWLDYKDFVEKGKVIDIFELTNFFKKRGEYVK